MLPHQYTFTRAAQGKWWSGQMVYQVSSSAQVLVSVETHGRNATVTAPPALPLTVRRRFWGGAYITSAGEEFVGIPTAAFTRHMRYQGIRYRIKLRHRGWFGERMHGTLLAEDGTTLAEIKTERPGGLFSTPGRKSFTGSIHTSITDPSMLAALVLAFHEHNNRMEAAAG